MHMDGPSNAMASSKERTSAETESSRLLHRGINDELLCPPPISVLEQIRDRKRFPDDRLTVGAKRIVDLAKEIHPRHRVHRCC